MLFGSVSFLAVFFVCALNAVTVPDVRFLSGCANVCFRIVGCANLSFPSGEKSQTGSWQRIQGLRLWFRVGGLAKKGVGRESHKYSPDVSHIHTHTLSSSWRSKVTHACLSWSDFTTANVASLSNVVPFLSGLGYQFKVLHHLKRSETAGHFIQVAEKGHQRLQLWH